MLTAVVGTGAVGGRIARRLAEEPSVSQVLVCGRRSFSAGGLAESFERVRECSLADVFQADLVVLATPSGTHLSLASRLIREHTAVISVSDHPEEVRGLLLMDSQAASKGVSLIVGAAFSPGLHVCARRSRVRGARRGLRHSRLASRVGGTSLRAQVSRCSQALRLVPQGGSLAARRGGSGREISWFPDPIGRSTATSGSWPSPTS